MPGARPPPWDPILSFSHTFSLKSAHVRGPRPPPLTGARPPTGNPGSATGKGCYVATSDMKSAFGHLTTRPQDREWFVMMAIHPLTGKKWFFIEKCLSFGHSISCALFQKVSDAIEHLFHFRKGHHSNNYLDDVFFVTLLQILCDNLVQQFLGLCEEISFRWHSTKCSGLRR